MNMPSSHNFDYDKLRRKYKKHPKVKLVRQSCILCGEEHVYRFYVSIGKYVQEDTCPMLDLYH